MEKIKIRANIERMYSSDARKLSQLLGKLNAATRAIPLAPLFYQNFQMALSHTLDKSGQDYVTNLHISEEMKEELQWWITHMSSRNSKTIIAHEPSLMIEKEPAGDLRRAALGQGKNNSGT